MAAMGGRQWLEGASPQGHGSLLPALAFALTQRLLLPGAVQSAPAATCNWPQLAGPKSLPFSALDCLPAEGEQWWRRFGEEGGGDSFCG